MGVSGCRYLSGRVSRWARCVYDSVEVRLTGIVAEGYSLVVDSSSASICSAKLFPGSPPQRAHAIRPAEG